MLSARGGAQLKDNILDACGLRGRPVDPIDRGRGSNSRCVDDEVPDLAIENIGRDPVQVLRVVRVCINEAKAVEGPGSLKSGRVVGVANQLAVERLVYGRGKNVRASREVDNEGSGSTRGAALVTRISSIDGSVDSRCIIG